VDVQTTQLLDALAHPGASIVSKLLAGPVIEAELLEAIDRTSQPTTNRRLAELERVGIARREPGKKRAPGRRWELAHPDESKELLHAAFSLADAISEEQRAVRGREIRAHERAKASRRGLRPVERGKRRPRRDVNPL
jgi:DNA-binding HxlR family transcriptional regulator